MKEYKKFVVRIGWCPEGINADDIRDMLEGGLGTFVEVVEE